MRRAALLLAGVVASSALVGCAPSDVHVSITPAAATYDVPVVVTATGLHGHETVTLRLTSEDRTGRTWRSSVTAKADDRGHLEHDAVDLLSRLGPGDGRAHGFEPPKRWTMRVDVLDGDHELAHRSFRRLQPEPDHLVTRTDLTLAQDGVVGVLYEPVTPVSGPTSAVVTFGGSEGGLGVAATDRAAVLAAHGHPAMAIGYFDLPGLPDQLQEVPLEYFATAVRRLAQAPGVDPARITVFGVSRGSEAAMLTALDFPGLVHGVIAGVPNAIVGGALGDRTKSAWTLGGEPLPFSRLAPEAPDQLAAVIDIGKFPGKVLVDCGVRDQVWDSCTNVAALERRDPDRLASYVFDDAGHLVGNMLPGFPNTRLNATNPDGVVVRTGGKPSANAAGDYAMWPRVLAFIDS